MKRNNNTLSLKATSPKLLRRYVRLLLWLNRIALKQPYLDFMDRILKLLQFSGKSMTIKYLKGAKLIVDHYLSGNPVFKSGHDPRIAISAQGLPLIIPPSLRSLIVNGDVGCIRVVLGVLSVFRIIPLSGQPDLTSITDPFSGVSTTLDKNVITDIWLRLFKDKRGSNPKGLDFPLPLTTAGPNYRISILGATADAYLISKSDNVLNPLRVLSRYFGGKLHLTLDNEAVFASDLGPSKEFKLGKLSAKQEAAGKVRLFAIVDVWTQSVLQPIHAHIFEILKQIPNDGAFDQGKPLQRLLSKKILTTFSYDLSSATDRFPIDLQVQVLSLIYTKEIAEAWKSILVDRVYEFKGSKYSYAVGQPMGALSSWAVFSLTHHFIVQYAASLCGYSKWFDDYALLGDDIVIANKDVAERYHFIMTHILGVKINLTKSIQSSKGVMEFAKRLVSPQAEYSPVGPKNVTLALKAPAHIPTLVLDYMQKGGAIYGQWEKWVHELTAEIVKVSKGNLEALIWSIIGPFGHYNSGHRFGPSRVENTLSYFKAYGVHLDLIDEVNDSIDKVIIAWLEQRRDKAKDKTYLVIKQFLKLREVPGFHSDTLQQSPVFRSFLLNSFESYFKLTEFNKIWPSFGYKDREGVHIPLSPGLPTIAEIVKFKFDNLATTYPATFICDKPETKRPRFRKINLDFFTKVNRELEYFFNEE